MPLYLFRSRLDSAFAAFAAPRNDDRRWDYRQGE
jgi:hypothetical protein